MTRLTKLSCLALCRLVLGWTVTRYRSSLGVMVLHQHDKQQHLLREREVNQMMCRKPLQKGREKAVKFDAKVLDHQMILAQRVVKVRNHPNLHKRRVVAVCFLACSRTSPHLVHRFLFHHRVSVPRVGRMIFSHI